MPSLSSLATAFVALNGSDVAGDGSLGRPFASIARALNATAAADSRSVFLRSLSSSGDVFELSEPVALRLNNTLLATYAGDLAQGARPADRASWQLHRPPWRRQPVGPCDDGAKLSLVAPLPQAGRPRC